MRILSIALVGLSLVSAVPSAEANSTLNCRVHEIVFIQMLACDETGTRLWPLGASGITGSLRNGQRFVCTGGIPDPSRGPANCTKRTN